MKYCICAIIKDEHKFLKEWLDYHLNLGFNHIYLTEDYGSKSHKNIVDNYENVTLYTLDNGDLPVKNYNTSKTQAEVYNYFLRTIKKEGSYDWILFTDIDEFLVFDNGYNLEKFCSEYNDYAGVYLSWKFYNANGHIKSPTGGVFESYTKEASEDERSDKSNKWMFKSFVNCNKANTFNTIHEIKDGVRVDYTTDVLQNPIYSKAWINHYFSKSWEDFCNRMLRRGNMSNDYRTFDSFFWCNKDMLQLKDELINSIRNEHTVNTFWISKEMKLISGGNKKVIDELNKSVNKKN